MEAYKAYLHEISGFIPDERIYTDDLRLLTWGTDAGFYRLIPQIVVRSMNEDEVSRLLALADKHNLPVTFRAAGTSLSGQSISDSILIVAGKHWEKYSISEDLETITLQPGIIGERVNQILKPFGRKFAPDPASVKSAMVGGIVMNNASGMNCGTHANSDKMLLTARIVFADGTILDTSSEQSKENFRKSKPGFIEKIEQLRDYVQADEPFLSRILHKYSIKNVTGLNILPLAIYRDPFDIITHLLVGSEGTLAFLSEFTMKTGKDYPFKASAMLYFNDIKEACRAVVAMNIGMGTLIYYNSVITHDAKIGEFCEISPSVNILGRAEIGDFTHVATGSIIFPDVKIGKNCIIAAGSVVRNNFPNNVMVAGIPAIIKKELS
jgi:D-lactate dehydrogenase